MTFPGLVLRNALRNKCRFTLTLSGVALSLFLLTVLRVVLRGLTDPATTDEAALRLVVRHKVSLANMLFAKYKFRVEKMPGVRYCLDRFIKERAACVVGIKTLNRFGWKIGDRITLMGAMWPCNLELTIRGVYSGTVDETNLFFHHEYFDELLGDKGFTGLLWVRAENAAVVPDLIERIDAAFANSDAETKTETEHSFQLGFVSMLGNLKRLIGGISSVIVFTLVLVTSGTMSMTIRERVREIAILKALGFGARRIFCLILAESFGLAMIGGLAGCLGAWVLVHAVDIYKLSRGLFVNFEVTPRILAQSLLGAALLGIVSCLWPAYGNLKRSVVEGLRAPD